jgi:microcin C transport system permease protein
MIERWLKNDLSKKRWRRFKRNKPAMVSIFILAFLFFFSFTAEIWCNNKPILLSYQGQLYFPVFRTYHPSTFGNSEDMITDYRSLSLSSDDWAIWPMIRWDPYESNKNVDYYPSPPSKENWLGTDDRGRDVLTRLLYGFRYTMIYALGVWLLSYIVGTLIGSSVGYFGGRLDLLGSRAVEIIETMPTTLLLITVISIFRRIFFGLSFSPYYLIGPVFSTICERSFYS